MALGRRSSRRPSRRPPIGCSDCTASSGCAWPTSLVKVWTLLHYDVIFAVGSRNSPADRCARSLVREWTLPRTWSRGGCGSCWTTATSIPGGVSCFPDRTPRNASQAYDAVVFAEESDRSQLIEEGFHPLQLQEGLWGRAVSSQGAGRRRRRRVRRGGLSGRARHYNPRRAARV